MSKHDNKYRLVVTRNDGGVSIIHPTGEESKSVSISKALAAIKGGYSSYSEVTDVELNNMVPPDRRLRNAWKEELGAISEDLIRSQDIIRAKRNEALVKLDGEAFAESRKPNGNSSVIDTAAQKMRDIPQSQKFKNPANRDELLSLLDDIEGNL